MDWLEVTIPSAADRIDGLCARLEELGICGLVIEDEEDFKRFLEENRRYWDYIDDSFLRRIKGKCQVKFYLEDNAAGSSVLRNVRNIFPDISAAKIKNEDWESNWKKYYKPIPVGRRILILPQWEETMETERLILRLDPGLIFGTGSHPTTRLCLEAIECCVRPGTEVLDMGCGSGILGIASILLGAKSCLGCDIDEKAPAVALENARLNGINGDSFTVLAGDILKDKCLGKMVDRKRYHLVLANIVADVIIPLSGIAGRWLLPGGAFICSGIIRGRETEVREALRENGFIIEKESRLEDWFCYICKNKIDELYKLE